MERDPRELGGAWRASQRHAFAAPSGELARYVARYWTVSWEYEQPYRQLVVPLPNVHLSFRGGGGAGGAAGGGGGVTKHPH
ncbi:DUF6597 domain-containing transcriptional factor, partial [Nocardia sp. NPDC058497]|uniref:DUF6597 domain-containing transcriptional factor n=1 Tax=Nocardia sp. NPDC058497 TaxID=3346529 RepID=UPI0036564E1E